MGVPSSKIWVRTRSTVAGPSYNLAIGSLTQPFWLASAKRPTLPSHGIKKDERGHLGITEKNPKQATFHCSSLVSACTNSVYYGGGKKSIKRSGTHYRWVCAEQHKKQKKIEQERYQRGRWTGPPPYVETDDPFWLFVPPLLSFYSSQDYSSRQIATISLYSCVISFFEISPSHPYKSLPIYLTWPL